MVRQRPARYAVAPGKRFGPGHVFQTAPDHEEGLGEDIIHIVVLDATKQVALKRLKHLIR